MLAMQNQFITFGALLVSVLSFRTARKAIQTTAAIDGEESFAEVSSKENEWDSGLANVSLEAAVEDWYLADPNENCQDHCEGKGLVCDIAETHRNRDKIESLSYMKTLAEKYDRTCYQYSYNYQRNSDVPNVAQVQELRDMCYMVGSRRQIQDWSCTRVAQSAKRRACWCSKTENTCGYQTCRAAFGNNWERCPACSDGGEKSWGCSKYNECLCACLY